MTQSSTSFYRLSTAILLVAGTCIGASMLALPVATFKMGYLPSLFAMAICWFFMTFSGLLFTEASLWMEEGAHFSTMSERLLGVWGKRLGSVLYLFIGYASLIAYICEGGVLLHAFLKQLGIGQWPIHYTMWLFTLAFSSVLFLSHRLLGTINGILVLGLILTYLFVITRGSGWVQIERLEHIEWLRTFRGLPLMLALFSFHSIVPSLTSYLNRDGQALRLSVILGTTLPLVGYILWQTIVIGSVPAYGPYSLQQALDQGRSAASSIRYVINDPWVASCIEAFAFFAIVTSFLGFSLGMFDFLADGLKVKKTGWNKPILALLVALPALLWAVSNPGIFLRAMDISGAFGDAIFNGIFPVLMVWKGRYLQSRDEQNRIPGGKIVLGLAMLFFLLAMSMGI